MLVNPQGAILRTDPQVPLTVVQEAADVHLLLQRVQSEEVGEERDLLQPRIGCILQVALPVKQAVADERHIGG